MSNNRILANKIKNAIKPNSKGDITGEVLQENLLEAISSLGKDYRFRGVAKPTATPDLGDENVFYIASEAGTYANYGNITLASDEIAVLTYNGSWQVHILYGVASKAEIQALESSLINKLNNSQASLIQKINDSENRVDSKLNAQDSEIENFEKSIRQQIDEYKPIVIEGNVNNAADEEDLTAVNGLLQLKDRNTLNGMGYIILRRDKSFKEQLTQANTIYEIRYDFDLGGEEVTIPDGCTLKFEGGSLSNGSIVCDKTTLTNEISFIDVLLKGNITNNSIYDSWVNDSSVKIANNNLKFLIENVAINNGILTVCKDYIIDYSEIPSIPLIGRVFVNIVNSEGFTIKFVNSKITEFIEESWAVNNHSFINIDNSNNINITGIVYECIYSDDIKNPYESEKVSGLSIISTVGDCGNCKFDLYGIRTAYILNSGRFGNTYEEFGQLTPNYVHKGFHNSELNLNGEEIGYAAAIYTGENLKINAHIIKAHRALYITGVNLATINIEARDMTTPVILLLKDSIYYDCSDTAFIIPLVKPCSNITAYVTDIGSTNPYTTGVHVMSYGSTAKDGYHFSKRSYPIHFKNIRCSVNRTNISEKSGKITAVVVSNLVRHLGDTCDIEIFNSNIDRDLDVNDALFTISSESSELEDSTRVTARIKNCNSPKAFIELTSPNHTTVEKSELHSIIDKETNYENSLILKNSVVDDINTYGNDVKTKLFIEASDIKNVTSKISFCNNSLLSVKKTSEVDFYNQQIADSIYYYELSESKTFTFPSNTPYKGSSIIILIKNISNSALYVSLKNAVYYNNVSVIQIPPNNIITMYVLNVGNLPIVVPHNNMTSLMYGATSNRPSKVNIGSIYFDVIINKPIWWTGTAWVDAMGNNVDETSE